MNRWMYLSVIGFLAAIIGMLNLITVQNANVSMGANGVLALLMLVALVSKDK